MAETKIYKSYCPKCGYQDFIEGKNDKCPHCGTKEIPTKYDWNEWLFGNSYPENLDEIIFNEYIKNNPEFDEELYARREGKEKILQQASLDRQINANKPKCPTCGSTKVHPISAGKKAVGFLAVGVFSKNFGKSYECDDCKYRW